MKLYIYITNAEQWLRGLTDWSLMASTKNDIGDWILAGSVDVEFDIDENEVRQIALSELTKKIDETRAKRTGEINRLEECKQNLMAIENIAWGDKQDGVV